MASEPKTFYYYFKPIAVICKLMGVFPLVNLLSSNDPTDLRVHVYSLAHLYNAGIFAFTIYMMWYMSGFVFSGNQSIYLCIVIYVIIARSVVCFVFCGTHFRMLPKMICMLDMFDKKKTAILTKPNASHWKRLIMWTILPIIIGIVSFASVIEQTMYIVMSSMPQQLDWTKLNLAAFFCSILSIWQILPLLVYIYFARRIVCNYKNINRCLKEQGFSGNFLEERVKCSKEDLHKTLEYLRYMHNMMTRTVYELGNCFGTFMAIDQLCIIAMVIANLCTFINDKSHNVNLMMFTFFNILLVICVLGTSHDIKETGTKVVELMHGIVFSKIDEMSRMEIQTLIIQIGAYPVQVSAAGYFTIDKTQIASVLSSIATYLVVSLQFLDKMDTCAGIANATGTDPRI